MTPGSLTRWSAIDSRIRLAHPHATLIAVSKSRGAAQIVPLLAAGQRDFGENKVQEAQAKWPALRQRYPQARLHLIGTLQTNKAELACQIFDVIQTVDREKLVDALALRRGPDCRVSQYFIQVNTGYEPQKGGVAPEALPGLLAHCAARGLPVDGLMCIPPAGRPPEAHFALLRTLAQEARLPCLSMGMSDDYETALRFGATHVRIGTALFGARD